MRTGPFGPGWLWLLCLFSAPGLARGVELSPEQHPSLLFSADQIPLLRERIQRPPYASWWRQILARARSVPVSFAEERSKVRWAESLAFAFVVTDSAGYGWQAAELLKAVRFPPRGGDLGQPHEEGEVVAQYAQAYDMVHQLVRQDSASLVQIRTILAEEATRLYQGIKVGSGLLSLRLHQTPHLDNWHLRVYSGLGLAAFALADHPGLDGAGPREWAARALDLVDRTLVYQVEEQDGGYAEGPFYLRYAADVYLPYLVALRRLGGVDLFAELRVKRVHDWSLALRLPSGQRPNVDDSHLDDFYGAYLAGIEEDGGVHRWDWENDEHGLYVREFSEMDAIALYDDRVAPREPPWGPTVFMPGAGDAVFRSDWSAQAVYLLLRGEHGQTRQNGLAHEHPDETSFVLYAHGEMLALDAGYIDFESHGKVNQGRNHNLVLVDGQGPPLYTLFGEVIGGGNDAFLEDFSASPLAEYAQVRAGYGGVQVQRRVAFVDRSYFVVADELRSDQVHLYEWRLHGNGGGSSGGQYQRQSGLARWIRPRAELLAFLPPLQGRVFGEVDTLHSFAYQQELTHTALRVQESGADAEFLAFLYPRRLDQAEPVFSSPAVQGGQAAQLALGEDQDVAWVRAAGAAEVELTGPAGPLRSDGGFGWLRYSGRQLRAAVLQDGRFLLAGTDTVLGAGAAVDVSLELAPDRVEGFARGPQEGYWLSLPLAGEVDSLTFGGVLLDSARAGDRLHLHLAGEGGLRAATGPPALVADFDGDGAVDFGDFFLFADHFGEPAQGEAARFDLDRSGTVDLGDFFLFADAFGERATP